jgi:hypothetical protein
MQHANNDPVFTISNIVRFPVLRYCQTITPDINHTPAEMTKQVVYTRPASIQPGAAAAKSEC